MWLVQFSNDALSDAISDLVTMIFQVDMAYTLNK